MYNKQLKIALLIFLSLFLVVILKLYLPKILPESSAYKSKLSGLEKGNIENLQVSKGSENLELKKEVVGWRLDGKRANKGKIEALLEPLLVPKSEPSIVAETNTRHNSYGVDKESALTVKLNDNVTVLIGLTNSDSGAYVRFEGSDSVYSVPNLSSSGLSSQKADWYDKAVLATEREKITKVLTKVDGKELSLMKIDGVWRLPNGSEADKDKVNGLAANLATLTAQSLADTSLRSTYPAAPTAVFTVDFDNQSETLELFAGPDKYLVVRTKSNEQFIVESSSINNLLNSTQELFK